MLKKLFGAFCYIIVKHGTTFWQNRKIFFYRKIADIESSASISAEGRIVNNRGDRKFIRIGKSSVIEGEIMIFKFNEISGGSISVGSNCYIGKNSKIWSIKSIKIGDRVLISHNVNIHDNNSHPLQSKERYADQSELMNNNNRTTTGLNEQEILIDDDAWIGFNVIILKGVKIGKGAIIGAGCIITEDVPDFAVVVGNPARIVKYTS